jgi:hypothetical protein
MIPTGSGLVATKEGLHLVYAEKQYNQARSTGHIFWAILDGSSAGVVARRIPGVQDAVAAALAAGPDGTLLMTWTNDQDVGEPARLSAALRAPGGEWRFSPPIRRTFRPAGGFVNGRPFVLSVSGTGGRCSEVTFRTLSAADAPPQRP